MQRHFPISKKAGKDGSLQGPFSGPLQVTFLNTTIFCSYGVYFTKCIMIWWFPFFFTLILVDFGEECEFALKFRKIHIARRNWPSSDPCLGEYQTRTETENDQVSTHSVKYIRWAKNCRVEEIEGQERKEIKAFDTFSFEI